MPFAVDLTTLEAGASQSLASDSSLCVNQVLAQQINWLAAMSEHQTLGCC